MTVEDSEGYTSLLSAVKKDCEEGDGCFNPEGCDSVGRVGCFHRYCDKFAWVIVRAREYAKVFGVTPGEVLTAWEKGRDYWYMNYYQDVKQPRPNVSDGATVVVVDGPDLFRESVRNDGFRCPSCGGVSSKPHICTCEDCDWKAYGLMGTAGKGVYIADKSTYSVFEIFMPVAWEEANDGLPKELKLSSNNKEGR